MPKRDHFTLPEGVPPPSAASTHAFAFIPADFRCGVVTGMLTLLPGQLRRMSKRVVILGGNFGIGYAAAECALAEGAQVTIASNDGANVQAALARLG